MSAEQRKRVVIDTNVLIRTTFIKRSPVSARIYQAIIKQECILVTSPAILEEIRDVINRDYIIAYTQTTSKIREQFLSELLAISMLTPGEKELKATSRDRKDNKFLICASEANAHYIVTSDKDLTEMKKYEDTKIIFPQTFAELLDNGTL